VPPEDPDILAAFNAWNEAASRRPRWPKPQSPLSGTRRKLLRGRLTDAGGLPGFLAVLAKAEASRFICDEMKGWSLDWFLKASNFTKVREGNYDNPIVAASPPAARPPMQI
jgi:hypothetical protein